MKIISMGPLLVQTNTGAPFAPESIAFGGYGRHGVLRLAQVFIMDGRT